MAPCTLRVERAPDQTLTMCMALSEATCATGHAIDAVSVAATNAATLEEEGSISGGALCHTRGALKL